MKLFLSLFVAIALLAGHAEARGSGGFSSGARSFSSGVRSGGFSAPRASSGFSAPKASTSWSAPKSSSDSAILRSSSAKAYNATLPKPTHTYTSPQQVQTYRTTVYRDTYHWSPPVYASYGPSHFGAYDAMFMWMMMDTINTSNHAAWMYSNRSDPAYQEWRAEAEKQAQTNAELKVKLEAMDEKMNTMTGQPAVAGLPTDVDPDVALSTDNLVKKPSHFWRWFLLTLLAGGVGFVIYRAVRPQWAL